MKYLAGIVGNLEEILDVLSHQQDSAVLKAAPDAVDWEAVNTLKIRAPRHLVLDAPGWNEDGVWCYVHVDGRLEFDEAHVVGVGCVEADVAAVYQHMGDIDGDALWHLAWERRFSLTCMLSKQDHQTLRGRTKRLQPPRQEAPSP